MKNPLPINSPHHPVYAQRWRAQRNDIKGKLNCSKRWSKRHEPSSTNSRSLEYNCISFILGHYARKSCRALRTMVLLVLQSCSYLSVFLYLSFSLSIPHPIPPPLSLTLSLKWKLLFKWQKQTCLKKNNEASLFFQSIVLLQLWKLLYDSCAVEYHWAVPWL